MFVFTALLAGLVFGIGLMLSGMANPAKVLGFLDLSGQWDPSLGLVMGGAVAVAAVVFALTRKRQTALLGAELKLPTARQIDKPLVIGSLVFGAGWGIAGFCPGPALVVLAMGEGKALVFVLAMLAGMGFSALFESGRR